MCLILFVCYTYSHTHTHRLMISHHPASLILKWIISCNKHASIGSFILSLEIVEDVCSVSVRVSVLYRKKTGFAEQNICVFTHIKHIEVNRIANIADVIVHFSFIFLLCSLLFIIVFAFYYHCCRGGYRVFGWWKATFHRWPFARKKLSSSFRCRLPRMNVKWLIVEW